MEIEGNSSTSCSFLAPTYFPPSGAVENGSDEEELTVLPRHTKVIVRGNNRTKSILVGLEGVVKKAVGLGGWHWLVLTNGVEVKLQRNALTVVEPPTGHEVDDDDDIAMNFPTDPSTADDFPTTFKPRIKPLNKAAAALAAPAPAPAAAAATPAPPPAPPDSTAATKESSKQAAAAAKEPKEASIKETGPAKPARESAVDLSKLQTSALRRYRKHFKLCDVGPSSSKEQLLHSIAKHFISHHLEDEVKVITGFVQAAKRVKT